MRPPVQPRNLVLRIAAKMLIPLILMFALYVQFHGEVGPGGGFQAGVIFAVAFILYALVFGIGLTRAVVSKRLLRVLASLGMLLYIGVGLTSLLAGANFLDYDVLAEQPIEGQHLGIFLVELSIGMTVAAIMMIIFFAFAERGVRP